MIRKIIEYSIKHKLIVALLVVTIIIGGLWAMKTISVDSTPDITNNQVQVITVAQNLSTTDIEQFITYPVEMATSCPATSSSTARAGARAHAPCPPASWA